VGLPVPPLTATVTVNACTVVMLDADGVTVTVGVVFAGLVTATEVDPVAVL
jgi:predicted RecA/RadA family phage recombinase